MIIEIIGLVHRDSGGAASAACEIICYEAYRGTSIPQISNLPNIQRS